MARIILYGMPGSLYTAKARAYLRKQRLEIEERVPGDPRFAEVVKRIGRWIIPVAEFPDGRLVQDSSAIIEAVETAGLATLSAYPPDPLARTLSLIFELFGGEGLLRPAMHYRWNFDAENLAFLRADFTNALAPGAPAAAAVKVFDGSSGRMRKAAESFGVVPATFAAVEASYREFLGLLDAHLADQPYLMGASPTIGDYGLIGPMHAHLARDPAPATLMKREALHVWRWVERMTAPDPDDGEFLARADAATDPVPQTLRALLAFIAEDYLPELEAMVAFVEGWLADKDPVELAAGPIRRGIGRTTFPWRGHDLTVGVAPYRLWLLQKVQDSVAEAAEPDRRRIADVLDASGLGRLLALRPARSVERRDNMEWWA